MEFQRSLKPGTINLQFELRKRFLIIICEMLFGQKILQSNLKINYIDPFTLEKSEKSLIEAIINIPNDQFQIGMSKVYLYFPFLMKWKVGKSISHVHQNGGKVIEFLTTYASQNQLETSSALGQLITKETSISEIKMLMRQTIPFIDGGFDTMPG